MPSKLVADAVEAKLEADWSHCPVFGVNVAESVPVDGSPFLVAQYPFSDARRMALGDRFYREDGAFRLVLHSERGLGLATALVWSDELATLFRDQEFGGIETQVPNPPFVDDRNDDGMYYVTAIVCLYTANYAD